MRVSRRITASIVASCLGAAIACSDSAQPLGSGDKFINDTAGMDVYSSPPPPPPPGDAAAEAYADTGYGYAPALDTCSSCWCDPTKNYCMSGGTQKTKRVSYPFGGGFGEPDGATGPPPAPCKVVDAGAATDQADWKPPAGNGCISLPPACAKTPTCDCLVDTLQPYYSCYLVCSPTPGFLEVYCPAGP
jgi:hypothetical protein